MKGQLDQVDILDHRQFYIAIRRIADTLAYGTDPSVFLGSGIDYVQSRLYQFGDPVRAIDWRVTARTQRVHIKEYEAPKRVPVYLLIDTSASMMVKTVAKSKYSVALQIAGGLALACLDRVSPVGIVGVGSREFRIKPSLSKDRVMEWLIQLRTFRYDEHTRLADRVSELTPTLNCRSLVIVLSDLHDEDAAAALRLLAQTHECIAIQVQDPAELGLRGSGFVRAREAESGKEFVTVGNQAWLDPEAVEQELRRGRVDHLRLRTDLPIIHPLRNFLQARGTVGKTAR